MKLKQGQQIGQRWIIRKLIGRGGNAEVWRAESSSGETAAVKVLRDDRKGSPAYRRFLDEIEIMKELYGRQGILPMLDDFTAEEGGSGEQPWLATQIAVPVSEALSGAQLGEVVAAVASFAATLAELATSGIHHRDIKPDNLFRLEESWVLGDFGLATFPGKEAVTEGGRKLGPVYYIAPEMLNNPDGANGGPADVYSLAKTLWVLATGMTFPIPGQLRRSEPSHRVSLYEPDPRAILLESLLEFATQDDPDQRPRMRDIASELGAWSYQAVKPAPGPDITELSALIEAYSTPGLQRQEAEKEREQSTEGTLARFREEAESLCQRITASVPGGGGSTHSAHMFERWRLGSGMGSYSIETDHVRGAYDYIALRLMLGVELLQNGFIYLVAGYAVEDKRGMSKLVWALSWRTVPGTVACDAAVKGLVRGLSENLPDALRTYLDRLQIP